jgi:hypothetical protein
MPPSALDVDPWDAAAEAYAAHADYLPPEVRDDPEQWDALLRLERAVCDANPYRAMGRYIHVGRKGPGA